MKRRWKEDEHFTPTSMKVAKPLGYLEVYNIVINFYGPPRCLLLFIVVHHIFINFNDPKMIAIGDDAGFDAENEKWGWGKKGKTRNYSSFMNQFLLLRVEQYIW